VQLWDILAKGVTDRSVRKKYAVDTDYRSGLEWAVDLASVCHIGRSNVRIHYLNKRKLQTAEEDSHVGLSAEERSQGYLFAYSGFT
jgi:hypothetical protein